ERRGEVIDASLERLQTAIKGAPEDPDSLCTFLLDSASRPQTGRTDDVTALVARLRAGEKDGAGLAHRVEEVRVQLTLPRDANAPAAARRLLEREFGDILEREELDRAKLAISELATNAVLHGKGAVTVLADFDDPRLLVEVVEQGSGFEHVLRVQDFFTIGGHGLNIVDS